MQCLTCARNLGPNQRPTDPWIMGVVRERKAVEKTKRIRFDRIVIWDLTRNGNGQHAGHAYFVADGKPDEMGFVQGRVNAPDFVLERNDDAI